MEDVIRNNEIIEEILNEWKAKLGKDYLAYKCHVYRVFNFCKELNKNIHQENLEKLAIAVSFHDLGIWSDNTFDYIEPAIKIAGDYLHNHNRNDYIDEISLMIEMHHKILPYKGTYPHSVEIVRCSDLVDLSLGMVKCGLSKQFIDRVRSIFPNNGFHKKLISLSINNLLRNPLKPFPMFRL